VSDKTLQQIHDLEFDKIFIWLDPDKAGKEGATKTHKKLTHYLPKETICTVLNALIEPKECTPKELHTFADAEGF
jgi:DNA primase